VAIIDRLDILHRICSALVGNRPFQPETKMAEYTRAKRMKAGNEPRAFKSCQRVFSILSWGKALGAKTI
jgi:hypothetical protein